MEAAGKGTGEGTSCAHRGSVKQNYTLSQLSDLIVQFEQTRDQVALSKCIEMLTTRLDSGMSKHDEFAEPKGVDTQQAARELQKCLESYQSAKQKMDQARHAYERELDACSRFEAELIQGGDRCKLSDDILNSEMQARHQLGKAEELESLESELKQALSLKQKECEDVEKELPTLLETLRLQPTLDTDQGKLTMDEQQIQRVWSMVDAVSSLGGVEIHSQTLARIHAETGDVVLRVFVLGAECEVTLAPPPDLYLRGVQVHDSRIPGPFIEEAITTARVRNMRPPDDIRYIIQVVSSLLHETGPDSPLMKEVTDLRKRCLLEIDGLCARMSIKSGAAAVLALPHGYPNTPCAVAVTSVTHFAYCDEDCQALTAHLNNSNLMSLTAVVEQLARAFS